MYQQCSAFPIQASWKAKRRGRKIEPELPFEQLRKCTEMASTLAALLRTLAQQGNSDSAEMLLELAGNYVEQLHFLAMTHSEILRGHAREMIVWPYFISRKKWFRRHGDELLKKLEVGAKPLVGGTWHGNAPAHVTACLLMVWLQNNQTTLRLPQLTKDSLLVWFEIAWQRLLFETNNRPDQDAFFGSIGKSALGKKSTSRGVPEQTERMAQSDVRAKIKEIVKKSFIKLFPNFPSESPPI
jgi:hypothetical protein